MLVLLLACSSSMDLVLTDVIPSPAPAELTLTPSSGTLKNTVPLQLLFVGASENPRPGTASITLKLATNLELGEARQIMPLPAQAYEVPFALREGEGIVTEAALDVPLTVDLDTATQRMLRSSCTAGTVPWQLTGTWETRGFTENSLGWRVDPARDAIPSLLETPQAVLKCALPERDETKPVVPMLQGTSPTQARMIGSFQDGHFDKGGSVTAAKLRPVGIATTKAPWLSTGEMRNECDTPLTRVQGSETTPILLGGTHPLQPRTVTLLNLPPGDGGRHMIENTWSVDLDGDGTQERVAVGEIDTRDYSFVSVSHGKNTDFVGFLHTKLPGETLLIDGQERHFTKLEGIADVDGDGRMELILSLRQPGVPFRELVVYAWSEAGFWVLAHDVQPERDCFTAAWKP